MRGDFFFQPRRRSVFLTPEPAARSFDARVLSSPYSANIAESGCDQRAASAAEVVVMGDPRLRVPGIAVAEERFGTEELQSTVDALIATMKSLNGAGIAATQIGIADRIFVVHGTGANPRYPYKPAIPLTVFINPEIEVTDDTKIDLIEGCLSVPGFRGQVQRNAKVVVKARRVDGSRFTVHAEGHAAGTMQHEYDHLDGKVFPDIARVGIFGPEPLMTWGAFETYYADKFLPYAHALNEEYPNAFSISDD